MPVKEIGKNAFYVRSDREKTTSVVIPEDVTITCESAFHACQSLRSITIPETVTKIAVYAFAGCYSLTSVSIPDTVTGTLFDSQSSRSAFSSRSKLSLASQAALKRVGYTGF
jgi:hypothetical protein